MDILCFFCLVFAMPLCASVYMCLVVTCWERAYHLAVVFVVFYHFHKCVLVHIRIKGEVGAVKLV